MPLLNRRQAVGAIVSSAALAGGCGPVVISRGQSVPAAVDAAVAESLKGRHIPGFAVAGISDGALAWSKGYGQANVKTGRVFAAKTIAPWASVTKLVTASAAMTLVEAGALDLKADVNGYLDFPVRNPVHPDAPITAFQLLTHLSSVRDSVAIEHSFSCARGVASLKSWLADYFSPDSSLHAPADAFHDYAPMADYKYANIGFSLLALIVEAVSGEDFRDYCATRIFGPLNIKAFWDGADVPQNRRTGLYHYLANVDELDELLPDTPPLLKDNRPLADENVGTFIEFCDYRVPAYGPDGLWASVEDLATFAAAFLNGGAPILGKDQIDAMLRDVVTIGEGESSLAQGYAWYRRPLSDERVVWRHSGIDPGVRAHLEIEPARRSGHVIVANTHGAVAFVDALSARLRDLT